MVVAKSIALIGAVMLCFFSCQYASQKTSSPTTQTAVTNNKELNLTVFSDDAVYKYLKTSEHSYLREKHIVRVLKVIDSLWKMRDIQSAKRIYRIYKQFYPSEVSLDYIVEKPIAKLINVKNFTDTSVSFHLNENTDIKLFAVGEGVYNLKTSLLPAWYDDNIEIFFDMRNNKYQYFDRNSDDRQYFLTWNKREVGGKNIAIKGLQVSQGDPSEHNYTKEIKFPWKTLGYVVPCAGASIGFDIMLDDNDTGEMDAQVTWHSPSAMLSNKTSLFGTLILSSNPKQVNVSNDTAFAIATSARPVIDGKEDQCWKMVKSYIIKRLVGGSTNGSADISGSFKALWDSENLYLLIDVTDDKKMQGSVLFDYGWIENMRGDTVWMMNVKQTKHAGGALKNRKIDSLIHLTAGNYILRYKSDNSHAYANWDDAEPKTSLYGIILYNSIRR